MTLEIILKGMIQELVLKEMIRQRTDDENALTEL